MEAVPNNYSTELPMQINCSALALRSRLYHKFFHSLGVHFFCFLSISTSFSFSRSHLIFYPYHYFLLFCVLFFFFIFFIPPSLSLIYLPSPTWPHPRTPLAWWFSFQQFHKASIDLKFLISRICILWVATEQSKWQLLGVRRVGKEFIHAISDDIIIQA